MSAPPGKFDEKAYREAAVEYLAYLKVVWELAVDLAEKCIAQPANPDDAEAIDQRRMIVLDLTKIVFEKLALDVRDIVYQEFWIKQTGVEE